MNLDLNSSDPLDPVRAEFLADLDDSGLDVTEWEAKFLDSTLSRTSFSPAQREVIDKMRTKYQHKL